jgi:hypothetical protein
MTCLLYLIYTNQATMKKLSILLIVATFAIYAHAQTVSQYKALNGVSYKVGDTVKLGTGSGDNGSFACLFLSGWNAAIGYDQNGAGSHFSLTSDYANKPMVIQKIDWYYAKGVKHYYFIVGDEGNNDYNLYIDAAVKTHEVLPFKMETAMAVK